MGFEGIRECLSVFVVSISIFHKEKVICEFDKDFKKSFSCRSNPSNDNFCLHLVWWRLQILDARSGKRYGKWKFFLSEIGSWFGEPSEAPSPRIPRNTPRVGKHAFKFKILPPKKSEDDFSDLSLHFLNIKPVSLVIRCTSRYVVKFAMGVKYDA